MSLSVLQARELMHEWVESPSLRNHMECVACCTRAYALRIAPEEADAWEIAGLLHDMDYERHPSVEEHPFVGVQHLRDRGDVDESILQAILMAAALAVHSRMSRFSAQTHHKPTHMHGYSTTWRSRHHSSLKPKRYSPSVAAEFHANDHCLHALTTGAYEVRVLPRPPHRL